MRVQFLLHIVLTIVWVFLTGSMATINFIFGFLLSYLVLWIISRDNTGSKYFRIVPKVFGFILFFLYELIKANIQVAIEVITPKNNMKPGIVGVPLDANTDLEITLLANIISLTPGTLSLDISEDKTTLYVHGMYVENKAEFIRNIKNGFEKRLLEILR
jgi:multicomponent Na+:H+ antiporter subunit E